MDSRQITITDEDVADIHSSLSGVALYLEYHMLGTEIPDDQTQRAQVGAAMATRLLGDILFRFEGAEPAVYRTELVSQEALDLDYVLEALTEARRDGRLAADVLDFTAVERLCFYTGMDRPPDDPVRQERERRAQAEDDRLGREARRAEAEDDRLGREARRAGDAPPVESPARQANSQPL